MRQFKGKDIKTGEWVYGYYFKDHKFSRSFILTGDTPLCYIISPNEVDPDTVGQAINDDGLYCGDIVKHSGYFASDLSEIGVVVYNAHSAFTQYMIRHKDGTHWSLGRNFEVMGNIHDNQELLEAK